MTPKAAVNYTVIKSAVQLYLNAPRTSEHREVVFENVSQSVTREEKRREEKKELLNIFTFVVET
jgi:hypothetical protein